ncbi:MAG: mechanosensitive ion channel family protein [Clostridia bacterium]|nr:mechanosensitive ion channel family protein [Clostridia bacterium]
MNKVINWDVVAGYGNDILRAILHGMGKICIAVLLLVIGFKLIKKLVKVIKKGKGFTALNPGMQTFLGSGISILLKIVLIIALAGYLGFPTASLITVLGSAGVAIGLALQGSLSNVSGGVILLLFKPFEVGDYIIVSDQQGGTVKEIGLFYTTLLTPDNRKVIVPNAEISNEQLINVTSEKIRRCDLKFSVAYDTDVDKMCALLLKCAEEEPLALKEPETQAVVAEYGDSAITFALRIWCNTPDYWTVYNNVNVKVKKALDREGITIPFPQMDVRIVKE